MSDRPVNCRNRLRDEGKPYPKSGCGHCMTGGMTGCPFEKKPEPPATQTFNFLFAQSRYYNPKTGTSRLMEECRIEISGGEYHGGIAETMPEALLNAAWHWAKGPAMAGAREWHDTDETTIPADGHYRVVISGDYETWAHAKDGRFVGVNDEDHEWVRAYLGPMDIPERTIT